ncbi:MAG: serine--tRNA ligase [Candidatus Tectomicrobia bacterium]|uniref:Serine--tRNA ligase n=1 Tax=Tectimicrobiota bacterium TaxID=2528274 RepID=A0A937W4R3_UNCTE|nr:serine--tRNA ligase [Candidatus Tectomicrobia bacterium]
MLDIRFIRENPALVQAGARKKRIDIDIQQLLALDEQRRSLTNQVENFKAQRNRMSREIPALQGEARQAAIAQMKQVADESRALEGPLREAEAAFEAMMLRVPNVPADDVPDGLSDADNVEVKTWGAIPQFDFPLRDHVELGEHLDILDIPRAVKLAGSRTYFLKNAGALLEHAVLQFALYHMVRKGFVPLVVPHLVKDEAMFGTAYFPAGQEQTYRLPEDQANLIGTAEVPVTAYHTDEILRADELPKYYVGLSNCYRREAGTYGKDTRGLYRIHQFQKVEQVVICANDPAVSTREHTHILQNAEEILQALQLPYRVVAVCGGDLGIPQVKKYDIETWMPSRQAYGETHSASKFHDFQARRLRLRYRDTDGTVRFVHTLNNTVIASPRILIPLLELNQRADGSVAIPAVLQPYMGGMQEIVPR